MVPGERFSGYSHLAGFILALAAALLLLGKTLPAGDLSRTAAAAIFAGCVIVLYAASTLFHSTRGRTKAFWERVDHASIYLLIAGTYTPFALGPGTDAWSWGALAAIWGLAALGVARELQPEGAARPSVALYVAMGWIGVIAAAFSSARIAPAALVLLLCGAALYTGGTVFYRNRRGLRHAHGLWHLFVLGGTASHYLAIGFFVL